MADHSIWYPGAPPAEPTLADDNEAIVTATAFYLAGTSKYCKGGAWRVPASAVGSLPGTVTIALHLVPLNTNPNLAAAADRSGTATVAAGWCVATWDPIEVAAGTAMWISTDAGEPYLHISVGLLGSSAIQATDGSTLYLSEADMGAGLQPRGYYDYAGPSGENQSQSSHAHDVIMSDSLNPPQAASITVAAVSAVSLSAGARRPATVAVPAVSAVELAAGRRRPSTIAVAATSGVRLTATGGTPAAPELTVGRPVPNPFGAPGPRGNAFAVGAPSRGTQ